MSSMAEHFETQQWVPYPVELVFAFFANPHNLPPLMPPETEARIEDMRVVAPPPRPVTDDPARKFQSLAAGAGSEIVLSFAPLKWLPRVSWTARIVEFAWNSYFIDEMVRGPFKTFRHRHGIAAERQDGVEGTVVSDSVEFALPGGLLGRLAAGQVWKQLQQSFVFRQQRLPEILAIAARQATEGSAAADEHP
jgi:ligand-binding SRPBCC domain-containing protein